MGRNHFVMETKAYCLICLKLPPARDEVSEFGTVGEERAPKVFSLQRVCHYLKLNMRKIFHDVIAVTPSSLQVLEKTELKGVLCDECSELTETFSEITLELEVLQMTLDACVRKLHDKVEVIHSNTELTEKFKKEMLNNPQTLVHYGIVEQLRKETLRKSSLLIEKAQPRVILPRLDIPTQVVPMLEVPSKPPSECYPVISSVQGNYSDGNNYPSASNMNSSSEHILSMELTAGNISPRPQSPTFTRMEMETVTEEPTADSQFSPLFSFPTEAGPSTLSYVPAPPPVFKDISFECKFCYKTFKKNRLRIDHEMTIHKGIKLQCSNCSKPFTSRSALYHHQQKCHRQAEQKQGTSGNQQRRNYQCPFCPVIFLVKSEMDQHIQRFHNQGRTTELPASSLAPTESVHFQIGNIERIELSEGADRDPLSDFLPEDEPEQGPQTQVNPEEEVEVASSLKCQYCGKQFSSASIRRRHQRSIHFGERHVCPLCRTSFTQRASMTSHLKSVCPQRNT